MDFDRAIEQRLRVVSEAHESIRLIRIDGDGGVAARMIDMTPRVGSNPDGDVIRVPERARKATDAVIASIQNKIIDQDASAPGGPRSAASRRLASIPRCHRSSCPKGSNGSIENGIPGADRVDLQPALD